ncbi:MAG: MltA domain-containing protein [Caulobacterales bacterium]|nr:MltA domain-containing protein [Caulobacterales bacterium]
MRLRVTGVLLALALSGCATAKATGPLIAPPVTPPLPPVVQPVVPPPTVSPFAALAGWDAEDHLAAFKAFRATCSVARDPAATAVCRKAKQVVSPDEPTARAFLEFNFRPEPVGDTGLLTAYFAPVYEARAKQDDEFSAPVRARPDDLVTSTATDAAAAMEPPRVSQRVDGQLRAYPDRVTIETEGLGAVLAWMRPEELFFLQIQGSGVLTFPNGERQRAAFAAHNGRPFAGIARPMREKSLLKDNETSGDSIRGWLAAHRGEEADAIMRLNPRYVFFSLAPDDDRDPAGAAGVSLPAGRAIAVDASRHDMGELFWIDASAPALSGAFPVYRRLVMALDTGGAIKGEVRADLYMGRGDAAGAEAGRVRHVLRMYRLVPVAPGGS